MIDTDIVSLMFEEDIINNRVSLCFNSKNKLTDDYELTDNNEPYSVDLIRWLCHNTHFKIIIDEDYIAFEDKSDLLLFKLGYSK